MKSLVTSALVAVLVVLSFHVSTPSQRNVTVRESAYGRVMRTKTLRCGWFAEPPFTNLDSSTGEKTGIVPSIVDRFASDYDVKVEWVTISNFALMGEDLKEGKYDAGCASLFNMPRGGLVDAMDAFGFMPSFAYVRSGETRFTSLEQLNSPQYIIAGQEGVSVTMVAQQRFPLARFHIIASGELSEMLASVVAKKADVAFMTPPFYQQFLKNNPGALIPLDPAHSLQTFAIAFGIKPEEDGLKSLFNNSLQRMIVSGDLASIFAKNDVSGTLIYPTINTTIHK